MDKITTDFIKATKKLYEQVSYILAELKLIGKDVKSIHKHKCPEGDDPESHESDPANSPIPSSYKTRKSYEAKQYSLDKLRYRLEKKAFHIGKWTAIILAIYTGLTGYQSCQAKRTADATVKAAEAAEHQINDTATNFRADQRAWIAVQNMKIRLPKSVKDNIAVHAEIVNVGKSFALDVKSTDSILLSHEIRDIADYSQHPDPKVIQHEPSGSGSIGSLAPNIPFSISTFLDEPQGVPTAVIQAARDQFLAAVIEHKRFVYFFGRITYSDVFKQTHYTNFCGLWEPDVEAFRSCPSYNDAN